MLNYIIYRIGEFLALNLPLRFSYAIAGFVATCQYAIVRRDRLEAYNNFKAIFPDKDKRFLNRCARNIFINFGKYLADFFRFRLVDRAFVERNIIFEGLENVDRALVLNRGLIIVSAHIGNWELGAAALGLLGYKLSVVALVHKHKRVDGFFNSQRESRGVKVIPLGKAARSCIETLQKNEILCLVGDKDFTGGGIVVDFFGRKAMVPKGPAALSIKCGSPISFVYIVKTGLQKFRMEFSPSIDFVPTGDYEKDVTALAGIYFKYIEASIRRYPDQWYCFRRFWI